MQRIEFIGNLTADPALREGDNWKVTQFTVAVNRARSDKDGNKVTDFFRVSVWGKLADACYEYLKKGRKVYVDGELQARIYDNQDGKPTLSLDVRADKVEFLSPKEEKKQEKPVTAADFSDINIEDIPF